MMMGTCQGILCLGLIAGVAVSHDPPHAIDPAPAQEALALGSFDNVPSTSGGPRHYRLTADPIAVAITVNPVRLVHGT